MGWDIDALKATRAAGHPRNAAKLAAAPVSVFAPDALTASVPEYDARPETWHGAELMRWARTSGAARFPRLSDGAGGCVLIHIPNERPGSGLERAVLSGQGVRPGVSDYFLPVPKNGLCGLWLELKKIGGKPTLEQREWLRLMRSHGYAAHVVEGWQAARSALEDYLRDI